MVEHHRSQEDTTGTLVSSHIKKQTKMLISTKGGKVDKSIVSTSIFLDLQLWMVTPALLYQAAGTKPCRVVRTLPGEMSLLVQGMQTALREVLLEKS